MVVRIAGRRMYLWRAVDHEGEVLDMLVQRRRERKMQGFKSAGSAQRFPASMLPSTTPSTCNVTSSREPPCEPFEPKQRRSGGRRSPPLEGRAWQANRFSTSLP
jgi:transposase-like protein